MKTKSFVVRYQGGKKNLEAFMLIKTFLTSIESAGEELVNHVRLRIYFETFSASFSILLIVLGIQAFFSCFRQHNREFSFLTPS